MHEWGYEVTQKGLRLVRRRCCAHECHCVFRPSTRWAVQSPEVLLSHDVRFGFLGS